MRWNYGPHQVLIRKVIFFSIWPNYSGWLSRFRSKLRLGDPCALKLCSNLSQPKARADEVTHRRNETRMADPLRKGLTEEGLEWSGVYSSSAMPTKPRSASESARRSRAPLQCPRNTRPAAPENKSPVSATDGRTSPHKTSRTGISTNTMPAYLEGRRYELGATRCDRCWRRCRLVAH
jgi:hypothetical protein